MIVVPFEPLGVYAFRIILDGDHPGSAIVSLLCIIRAQQHFPRLTGNYQHSGRHTRSKIISNNETDVIQTVVKCVYRVTVHPLSIYPGPLLAKFTDLYGAYHAASGDLHLDILRCHQQYGQPRKLTSAQ